MNIAVIGGGISGIAAARVLQRFGHRVVVFERNDRPGGVWAVAYPEVRLQNISEHYRLAGLPWPFAVDQHPSSEQILRYLQYAIERFAIDLRTRHDVTAAHPLPEGWELDIRGPHGESRERFDWLVVAAGQYTGEQHHLALPGRDGFAGRVLTDRDVRDLSILAGKRVAVVGFGKSAVDMASFAADRGSQVDHVFREPRWLIPRHILGIHGSKLLFARHSTAMITSWVHPRRAARLLHERLTPLVSGFWTMIAAIIRAQTGLHRWHLDPDVRRRFAALSPSAPVPYEMRSAAALAPDNYYPHVAAGRIEPHRGEPAGFTARGLVLKDGRELPCDLAILSTGFKSPRFPYLPAEHRALLESEPDGAQLYRHLLHPQIPRVAFAGYNHGFLHVPAVEIATLWLCALLRGDLALPGPAEMARRIDDIRRWKREHILFEPSRGCATSTRFHQYLDVLLADLGVKTDRKRNPIAELLAPYTAADYDGVIAEYERLPRPQAPRRPLPLST
jgi:dimethylaniline monooxygenase (N-oxide forming)